MKKKTFGDLVWRKPMDLPSSVGRGERERLACRKKSFEVGEVEFI